MLILPFEITQSSFPSDEYSGAAADDRSGFEDFQLAAFCCSFFSLFNFRVVEGKKKCCCSLIEHHTKPEQQKRPKCGLIEFTL